MHTYSSRVSKSVFAQLHYTGCNSSSISAVQIILRRGLEQLQSEAQLLLVACEHLRQRYFARTQCSREKGWAEAPPLMGLAGIGLPGLLLRGRLLFAPRPDGPHTHFTSPCDEKCRLAGPAAGLE